MRAEGRLLIARAIRVRVRQGPGVGGGARYRDAVAEAGLQIGGGGKPGEVGSAGGGYGRVLVGAAAAHLQNGAAIGGGDHAGCGRGDGGIGIQDRQHDGFEHHALTKGAAHRQDRRVGKIQLALAVAIDLPGKAPVTQVLSGIFIQEIHLFQLLGGEAEVLYRAQHAVGAGDDAVATLIGQAAGKDLAGHVAVGCAIAKRGLQHGELVFIREQSGGAIDRACYVIHEPDTTHSLRSFQHTRATTPVSCGETQCPKCQRKMIRL